MKESALTSDGSTPKVAVNLAIAYHEAGHAVVALALGRNVQRVSILPNQLRLGQCELKKGRAKSAHDPVEVEILILLGGVAAEACYTGEYAWAGAQQDMRAVRAMTSQRASGEKQIARLERRLFDKVEHLLADPAIWRATEWIAAELLRCTTISGRAARHLIRQLHKWSSFMTFSASIILHAIARMTRHEGRRLPQVPKPAAGRKGLIAWPMHNATLFDEYKDVVIEVDPHVHDLVTTK